MTSATISNLATSPITTEPTIDQINWGVPASTDPDDATAGLAIDLGQGYALAAVSLVSRLAATLLVGIAGLYAVFSLALPALY